MRGGRPGRGKERTMKGIAAFMVLSLLTRSHVAWDDRQYVYPRPPAQPPADRPEAGGSLALQGGADKPMR